MRHAVLYGLTLVVAFGTISDRPPPNIPDPMQVLDWALPAWSRHHYIGPLATRTIGHIRAYKNDHRLALYYAQHDSLHITVVGQIHPAFTDTAMNRPVMRSQRQVFRALTAFHPQLVSIEGWTADSISLTNIRATSAKTENSSLAMRGAVRYLAKHDSVSAMGAEDQALFQFGNSVAVLIYDPQCPVTPEEKTALEKLFVAVLNARSQLAIDRTVIALHRRKLHTAVLVIGAGHGEGCLDEARRLGLPATYIPTNR